MQHVPESTAAATLQVPVGEGRTLTNACTIPLSDCDHVAA